MSDLYLASLSDEAIEALASLHNTMLKADRQRRAKEASRYRYIEMSQGVEDAD